MSDPCSFCAGTGFVNTNLCQECRGVGRINHVPVARQKRVECLCGRRYTWLSPNAPALLKVPACPACLPDSLQWDGP